MNSRSLIDAFAEFIYDSKLTELDLSWAKINPRLLATLMETILEDPEDNSLRYLSLKGVTVFSSCNLTSEMENLPAGDLGKTFKVPPTLSAAIESGRETFILLQKFLAESKLQHLDLSYMELGAKVLDLLDSIDAG